MSASVDGHIDVVRLLLDRGADINIDNKVVSCMLVYDYDNLTLIVAGSRRGVVLLSLLQEITTST